MKKFLIALVMFFALLAVADVDRGQAAVVFITMYENQTGKTAEIVQTPFTDIADLDQSQQDAIAKLYGLQITAGTSGTTYSPNDPLEPYQFFIFLGKTLMRIDRDKPAQ